jgi:5-methylcytosine-specific restriction enzyme subunit McrC
MNHFFQRLLSRFLHDALPGCVVSDAETLHGMMRYAPAHNPRGKRSPEPRPDFVVRRSGRVVAVLDAKYRDLWEHDLPRDMLYQLAIYALSREGRGSAGTVPAVATAAILYPTLAAGAREARIEIRDPVRGRDRATVVLRPVDMNALSRLVALPPTAASADAQRRFALQMCFGGSG